MGIHRTGVRRTGSALSRRSLRARGGGMGTRGWITLAVTVALAGVAPCSSVARASSLLGNVSMGGGEHWVSKRTPFQPEGNRRTGEVSAHALLGHRALPMMLEGYGSRTRDRVDTATEAVYDLTTYEVGIGVAG